jgi:hypothetical protein
MDLNLDKPFIIKAKKIKEVVFILNNYIESELKKTSYYDEDKEYFSFKNIQLRVLPSSFLRIKKLNLKRICFFAPKFIILKNYSKINDHSFEKYDWMITSFNINDEYESETTIYAFALS